MVSNPLKAKKEKLGLSREVTIQSSSFSFQAMTVMVEGTNEKLKNKNKNKNRMTIFGVWYRIKNFNTVLWTDLPPYGFWGKRKSPQFARFQKGDFLKKAGFLNSNWRRTEARTSEAD